MSILGSRGSGGGGIGSKPVKGQVMGGGVVYGYSGGGNSNPHAGWGGNGGVVKGGSGPIQNWGQDYIGNGSGSGPTGWTMPEFNVSVERDSRLDDMYDAFGKYNEDLTKGADADANTAMGRQRDLISGMANEFQGMSAGRGTFGSGVGALGTARILNKGQQALASTNSQLAADARSKRLQAMSGQLQAANSNASYLTGQQNYALSQWQAQQSAAQNAQQMQNQQMQQNWQNQMQMMNMFYSG